MQPHDYVLEPGNQIGVVIDQSDWGQFQNTIRPEAGAELTIIPVELIEEEGDLKIKVQLIP